MENTDVLKINGDDELMIIIIITDSEDRGFKWDMQLVDGCSLELCVAKLSVVFSGIYPTELLLIQQFGTEAEFQLLLKRLPGSRISSLICSWLTPGKASNH